MQGSKSAFSEFLESIIIAIILATVIRVFLFQPFYIPSGSMEPTLMPGDRIIVNKLVYRYSEPERGDVVVFKYPLDPEKDYIKRIVAVSGERIEVDDGRLFINYEQVSEHYLPPGLIYNDFGPAEVPAGQYFVMGDNRNNSQDSRIWGPLPRDNFVGKAVIIFWPLNRIGLIQ
ncbi:MAG: signal peptidase I [Syntrophomonadaceae bacterium]|nr:signal peptidase I [Syntrophomonadaceae bacterium]